MGEIVRVFQDEMAKLVVATDDTIVKKKVTIGHADTVFPAVRDLVLTIDEPAIELATSLDSIPRMRRLEITKARCQMPIRFDFELRPQKGINIFSRGDGLSDRK